MDLKYKDSDILIGNVPLPTPFKISLSKRGKTVYNHRYLEVSKKLQIQCSNCSEWFSVYLLENGSWIDINADYKVCNLNKENQYFDSYCKECYTKKVNKNESANDLQLSKAVKNGKSLNNERMQRTVFLSKENDLYLQICSVIKGQKKNELINEIIDIYRKDNQITF